MVLFTLVFFLIPSSLQTTAGIVVKQQGALYHHESDIVSHGNFEEYAYNTLESTNIASFFVNKQSECPLKCVSDPKCYSCNVAAYPDSKGLYRCDLQATDKYREKAKFIPDAFFHHFAIWVSSNLFSLHWSNNKLQSAIFSAQSTFGPSPFGIRDPKVTYCFANRCVLEKAT